MEDRVMVQAAAGWELDVERGPDWLFVRPRLANAQASDTPQLAEEIWALLEQNFSRRLVLEMDQVPLLYSHLIGQLVWLYKRRVDARWHAADRRPFGPQSKRCCSSATSTSTFRSIPRVKTR